MRLEATWTNARPPESRRCETKEWCPVLHCGVPADHVVSEGLGAVGCVPALSTAHGTIEVVLVDGLAAFETATVQGLHFQVDSGHREAWPARGAAQVVGRGGCVVQRGFAWLHVGLRYKDWTSVCSLDCFYPWFVAHGYVLSLTVGLHIQWTEKDEAAGGAAARRRPREVLEQMAVEVLHGYAGTIVRELHYVHTKAKAAQQGIGSYVILMKMADYIIVK